MPKCLILELTLHTWWLLFMKKSTHTKKANVASPSYTLNIDHNNNNNNYISNEKHEHYKCAAKRYEQIDTWENTIWVTINPRHVYSTPKFRHNTYKYIPEFLGLLCGWPYCSSLSRCVWCWKFCIVSGVAGVYGVTRVSVGIPESIICVLMCAVCCVQGTQSVGYKYLLRKQITAIETLHLWVFG